MTVNFTCQPIGGGPKREVALVGMVTVHEEPLSITIEASSTMFRFLLQEIGDRDLLLGIRLGEEKDGSVLYVRAQEGERERRSELQFDDPMLPETMSEAIMLRAIAADVVVRRVKREGKRGNTGWTWEGNLRRHK